MAGHSEGGAEDVKSPELRSYRAIVKDLACVPSKPEGLQMVLGRCLLWFDTGLKRITLAANLETQGDKERSREPG